MNKNLNLNLNIKFLVLKNISKSLINNNKSKFVRLIAVSKTKSVEEIMNIYNEGHRDFGENYVNELLEKYEKLPADINWYMIGHLQSNKCKNLLQVKNLKTIETVDSFKLAETLNKEIKKINKKIEIYLQVNISKESTKSGILPECVIDTFEEVLNKCDSIIVKGLMSIGNADSRPEFEEMFNLKTMICEKFSINKDDFIISFGTSEDYENAILNGSNEIRIGTLLFGERNYNKSK